MTRFADGFAVVTLLAAVAGVLWIGLDAWILRVWVAAAGVLFALWLIGRALAREFGLRRGHSRRLPWLAGAIAAFVSCTMAAGLVRVEAPVRAFVGLAVLMLLAVTSLRLAYHRTSVPDTSHK